MQPKEADMSDLEWRLNMLVRGVKGDIYNRINSIWKEAYRTKDKSAYHNGKFMMAGIVLKELIDKSEEESERTSEEIQYILNRIMEI
jgi:hypothetical protein